MSEVLKSCIADEKDLTCIIASHDAELLAIERERYALQDGRVKAVGS
ncbi:MAG: hypothetical protein Q6373_007310 [Candidatus Sigynarchaeota archaeon]